MPYQFIDRAHFTGYTPSPQHPSRLFFQILVRCKAMYFCHRSACHDILMGKSG